ncbi:MAG: sugar ABC transporter permease [Lachnospiraceae bacterium]|nr:sugar ABC transporter permease [Lachnospiraceae bacterium]
MKKFVQTIKKEYIFHLFMLPAVVLLFIFHYIPLGQGIIMTFQDFNPAKGLGFNQEWVGWDNYKYIFDLIDFRQALTNTLIIACSKTVLFLVVPIAFALFLNEVKNKAFKKTIQTVVTFPHFVSWVMLGGILIQILSPETGAVNKILGWFGVEPIYFLGDGEWFRGTMIVTDLLKGFGYSSIVYLAAMSGIDQEQYEAADLDGGSRLQKMWYITLPGIKTVVILMMTLSLGGILNAGFDQVYNLLNSAVLVEGEILDTLIYKVGLGARDYSVATAMNMFKSLISVTLIGISYWIAYKKADYVIF